MKRPKVALVSALALTTGIALAGCSSSPSAARLEVSAAYMPQPVRNDLAGGYLTVTNAGNTADQLVSVSSDVAEDMPMRETIGDAMRPVKSFRIPPNGNLVLERGGRHLMFTNLRRKPARGDIATVELRFAASDPITLDVPVKGAPRSTCGSEDRDDQAH